MNELLQPKLSEILGANNISYILTDNKDFSVTGYKVMKNQTNSGLLRCAKIMYNGKIKLVYMIDGSKPLSYVATRLGVNELTAVVFNLIQRIMDIKSNGFFRAENLELDANKIFVDVFDYSVHLIYFPISGGATGKITAFENEFRVFLINLFNSFPVFSAPQFQKLCSDLSNGTLPLDVILRRLQENINGNNNQKIVEEKVQPFPPYNQNSNQGNQYYNNNSYQNGYNKPPVKPPIEMKTYVPPVQIQQPVMTLTAINSPVQMVMTINRPEFLIGKNPEMVNGAVTHNPAISRVHCKINFTSGKYYITDMGSANGTFVNQQRLEKHQTVQVKSGDYIKLANSDFIIKF